MLVYMLSTTSIYNSDNIIMIVIISIVSDITMVVFKMCDSVPSVRYSSVCNVLIASMENLAHPYL